MVPTVIRRHGSMTVTVNLVGHHQCIVKRWSEPITMPIGVVQESAAAQGRVVPERMPAAAAMKKAQARSPRRHAA